MNTDEIYLSKAETGLPFDVVRESHFENYYAKWSNGMRGQLSTSDLINIHALKEMRRVVSVFDLEP